MEDEKAKAAKNVNMLQSDISNLKAKLNVLEKEKENTKAAETAELAKAKQLYENEIIISSLQKTLSDIESRITSFDYEQRIKTDTIISDFLQHNKIK